MASQKDFTIAAYQYMLSLGVMAKGEFICVNQEVHRDYQRFDTELEVRAHWEKCHKIALTEEFNMFVLPDSSKEPAQLIKLPMLVAPTAAGGVLVAPTAAGGTRKKRVGSRKARPPPATEPKEVVATPPHKPWEDQVAAEGEPDVATEPLTSDID